MVGLGRSHLRCRPWLHPCEPPGTVRLTSLVYNTELILGYFIRMLGAFAGNRLGAIRDAKGKSVAAVFNQLGGNQKAEVNS